MGFVRKPNRCGDTAVAEHGCWLSLAIDWRSRRLFATSGGFNSKSNANTNSAATRALRHSGTRGVNIDSSNIGERMGGSQKGAFSVKTTQGTVTRLSH
jgi:hypothetical protein